LFGYVIISSALLDDAALQRKKAMILNIAMGPQFSQYPNNETLRFFAFKSVSLQTASKPDYSILQQP
jgi:hypothetical protein